MFDPEMKAIDDLASSRGGFQGSINVYGCQNPQCQHEMVTIDRHQGVTPFLAICSKCGGMSQSRMYNVDQALAPALEWYRPESLTGFPPPIQEHLRMGGLVLRQIDGRPPISIMSAEAVAVIDKALPIVRQAMGMAFAEALALKGDNAAAIENDALSVVMDIAVGGLMYFIQTLQAQKSIPNEAAVQVAGADFNLKFQIAYQRWIAESAAQFEADAARADGRIN